MFRALSFTRPARRTGRARHGRPEPRRAPGDGGTSERTQNRRGGPVFIHNSPPSGHGRPATTARGHRPDRSIGERNDRGGTWDTEGGTQRVGHMKGGLSRGVLRATVIPRGGDRRRMAGEPLHHRDIGPPSSAADTNERRRSCGVQALMAATVPDFDTGASSTGCWRSGSRTNSRSTGERRRHSSRSFKVARAPRWSRLCAPRRLDHRTKRVAERGRARRDVLARYDDNGNGQSHVQGGTAARNRARAPRPPGVPVHGGRGRRRGRVRVRWFADGAWLCSQATIAE